MRFTHYLDKPLPIDKIEGLCKLLRKETYAYQVISSAVKDKKVQSTMLALAEESNQYANELYSEVLVPAGMTEKTENSEENEALDPAVMDNKDALGHFCNTTEMKLVKAYREVLNESFFNKELRKKINDQLNGTLCNFMRLKIYKNSKY